MSIIKQIYQHFYKRLINWSLQTLKSQEFLKWCLLGQKTKNLLKERISGCLNIISVHKKHKSSVMASMKVEKKTVSRWGIYNLSKKVSKNNFIIKEVVEKPSIKNAPSNKAVIGRYILPKIIFNKLSNQKPGKGGEIHITDAIQSLINENERFIAHNFTGKYLDCGTMNGFIKSNIEISKLWNFAW